jgi:hypothetical protein
VAMVPAFAQNISQDIEVKFKVPMAFYAGDKLLPAGEYEAKQRGGEQANTMVIRGKGKNEAVVGITIVNSSKPVKATEVTFNKYGDKDYLAAIIIPADGGGSVTQVSFVLKVNPTAAEQADAKAAAATQHSVAGTSTKK